MNSLIINFYCNTCSEEFELEVDYLPPVRGYTGGKPEDCFPDDPGHFDLVKPENCPKCGTPIDKAAAHEALIEQLLDWKAEKYENPEYGQ